MTSTLIFMKPSKKNYTRSTKKLITADKICHYYYKTSLTKMWSRVANLVPSSQAPTKLPGTIKGCENKS